MTPVSPSQYVWWLAGRSAGFVALLALTASVTLGLAMAARVLPRRFRRNAVSVHQHLALIGLASIAAHGLLLAADPWLKAGAWGILVPFAMSYRPVWTGVGIVGGYLVAVLGLSFYARRRIGARLWRKLHRFTVLGYLLSLVHALGAGTDTSIPVVRWAVLGSAVPALGLFALRMVGERHPRPRPRPAETARPVLDPPRKLDASPSGAS